MKTENKKIIIDIIIKESNKNKNNLIAINKKDVSKTEYIIQPINSWRLPFLTLKHNNFNDIITMDFLLNNYNIYNDDILIHGEV